MPKFIDLTGQKFSRLTAVCRHSNAGKNVMWDCVCECGKRIVVYAFCLKNGNTKSCGCLNSELKKERGTKHGMCGTQEYTAWGGMIQRTTNTKSAAAKHYILRGITVCERWMKFENFLYDMGKRPSPLHSIDRIDNNGNYEPENCRWATKKEQARNTRSNRMSMHDGKNMCISEISEITGIKYTTLLSRLNVSGD